MKKVVFIAKTNLNNDGRILNQIEILEKLYGKSIFIDFILLADTVLKINLGENVRIHTIETTFRNNVLLRPFTVMEFLWKSILLLFKLKPKILHAHDMAIILPAYIYRLAKGNSFKLIYDDHEMPNENEPFSYKILQSIEVKLMKKADTIIFANKERMNALQEKYKLDKSKLTYFLNLPYSRSENENKIDKEQQEKLNIITNLKEKGVKLIMHQGPIKIERGRVKLASIVKILPEKVRILIVGASEKDFDSFTKEFDLDKDKFLFIGSVPYFTLNEFWKLADATIVMYLPDYSNNRLCAPNRLYIGFQNQLPIIVNKQNPVLNNFITEHRCGLFIEDLEREENIEDIFKLKYESESISSLKNQEKMKLKNIYDVE